MRSRIDLRGTIYHLMDARGMFASNPANVGAQDDSGTNIYRGPVEYPKMYYHPTAEVRVTASGEKIREVDGTVTLVGRQTEIIHRVVKNKKEEDEARKEGWHDHPAKAITAGIEAGTWNQSLEPPAMSSAQQIEDLQSQIERLQAQLAASSGSGTVSKSGGK